MFGHSQDPIDYWSVLDDAAHMSKYLYEHTKANPTYYNHIQFDANQDLIHQQGVTQTILTIFFWLGGWFAFMFAIGSFLAYLIYPHLAYLSVVLRLF